MINMLLKKLRSKAGYQNDFLTLTLLLGLLMPILGKFFGKVGLLIGLGLIGVSLILGIIYDPKRIVKQIKEDKKSKEENEKEKKDH